MSILTKYRLKFCIHLTEQFLTLGFITLTSTTISDLKKYWICFFFFGAGLCSSLASTSKLDSYGLSLVQLMLDWPHLYAFPGMW